MSRQEQEWEDRVPSADEAPQFQRGAVTKAHVHQYQPRPAILNQP